MSSTTHYDTLGVKQSSTKEEIISAYRRLAMQWHPDRHIKEPDKTQAEATFKKINVAYTILSDDYSRRNYDSSINSGDDSLQEWARRQQHAYYQPHPDYQQQASYDWREHLKRGANVKKSVTIPIETAIEGGKVTVTFPDKTECDYCGGEGMEYFACEKCNGTGLVVKRMRCNNCGGHGVVIRECEHCEGTGEQTETQHVLVNLPKGTIDGSILTAKGKGKASKYDGYNGDIIITVKIRPAGGWKYKGSDINGVLKIPFPLAVLGGVSRVELPTGKLIEVSIPPHTNSGKKFRLVGEGLFDGKEKIKGDAILTVSIVLPNSKRKLTTQEKEVISSFLG